MKNAITVPAGGGDDLARRFAARAASGPGHRSAAERGGGSPPGPVEVSGELWSYEIARGLRPIVPERDSQNARVKALTGVPAAGCGIMRAATGRGRLMLMVSAGAGLAWVQT